MPRALQAPGALSMGNTRMAPEALRTNKKPVSIKTKDKPKLNPKAIPKSLTKKATSALRKTIDVNKKKKSVKPDKIKKPDILRVTNKGFRKNVPGALRTLKTPEALRNLNPPEALITQQKIDNFENQLLGITQISSPKPLPCPQPLPVVKPKPAQECRPVRRKEVRDLTSTELKRYINAINKLHSIKDGKGSKFDKYTELHLKAVGKVHGKPAFLPWHRQLTRKYELDLQSIDPEVVLPYWDWTIDSQNPERSPILSSKMFGGNGDPDNDYCLTEGPFANWNLTYPTPHCLRRDYRGGSVIPSFTPTDVLHAVLQNKNSFGDFAENLEAYHGPVHLYIGGKRGDLSPMHSPNDPLFFLHHTFIDMLWYNWQRIHPKSNQYGKYLNSDKVTSQENLHLFDIKVEDLLDTRNPNLCYYYDPYHPELSSLKKRTGFDFKTLAHRRITNKSNKKFNSEDRKTKGVLRIVDKLPADWIKMNNLNPDRVRQIEEERDTITENLNALSVVKFSQLE